ncbi:prenyltransferase [Luteolibacter arcticus]|uniref:Prenyltransferase n=1 Tax=Luteolibacter arcticus TaxID=1581411 RepID=A0ABT3GK77_9BACT|nr:prenyltransferase [Luteolibacter arcticus]MCW1923925.1 prenyltransferase [Luteolibacter arcticus]
MTDRPGNSEQGIALATSRIVTWLRALRLPFYPMSWLGYTTGAALVVPLSDIWRLPAYWWGFVVVFLIEALTVFVNDLYDFESDRRNQNHGNFTGGSRVLVEGLLTPDALRSACKVVAVGAALGSFILQAYSPAPLAVNLACLGTAVLLGVGYTAPPLKLSHRGWGEVVVAFAHSLLVVQCGALVVGGQFGDPAVFKVALPLFFAIFPSISLSGLPDHDADIHAGKRTLAVKLGPRPVLVLASVSALAACVLVIWWSAQWPSWTRVGVVLHALLVVASAMSQWSKSQSRRIDGVMVSSLSFVLWFTLVPLLAGLE